MAKTWHFRLQFEFIYKGLWQIYSIRLNKYPIPRLTVSTGTSRHPFVGAKNQLNRHR